MFVMHFFISGCLANLPPLFTLDMNNIVISENTPVGTVIYTLKGNDPENSPVHYDLQGTDALKVDHTTGDVTVVKPLDYEVRIKLFIVRTWCPISKIGFQLFYTSGSENVLRCVKEIQKAFDNYF